MRLSHSKLSTILKCPATYNLSYNVGLKLKYKKPALTIGEAVHWGLEHNTSNLDGFYEENPDYSKENKSLEESMVYGYLLLKEQVFNDLLTDDNGEKLELLEELHEVELVAPLKSIKTPDKPHEFVGIIDLLLVTNKGLIVVDYKTSSMKPNFDNYLDQLYRYDFLLKHNMDLPIYRLAIINLQKCKLKKLRLESEDTFKSRLEREYELNDNELINWHIYSDDVLDENLINNYINNLSYMADTAELIENSNEYYVNYSAINDYGGNDYKEIFVGNPSAYILYTIKDNIYDKDYNILKTRRDCNKLDIEKLKGKPIINNYSDFQLEIINFIEKTNSTDIYSDHFKSSLKKHLNKNYEIDSQLLEYYFDTFYYYLNNLE